MNNFTPRAQQVLALSCKEANGLHSAYVGTEHFLLGLIRLGQGVAYEILQKHGLALAQVRNEIGKVDADANFTEMPKKIRYTTSAKKALAFAGKEAKGLGHSVVGTEHILLGLLRENGVAAKMLVGRGATIEETRNKVFEAFKNSAAVAARSKPVHSNQRLPILIMSSVVAILLFVITWFQLVRH